MLTTQMLSKMKKDAMLYCCNPNKEVNEFMICAKVLNNDVENQEMTLERSIKYRSIPEKTVTWKYEMIIDAGYEPFHPAYLPLIDYRNKLVKQLDRRMLFDEEKCDMFTDQEYVLDVILEGVHENSSYFYEEASMFCLRNDIRDVTDIGCCFGFQSEFFIDKISYTGVESSRYDGYFWKESKSEYIHAEYPCELPKGTMAMSHLCIGFLCTGEEVYKTLADQFEYLAIDNDHEEEFIKKYFTEVERTTRNPYIYPCSEDKYVTNMIIYKRK